MLISGLTKLRRFRSNNHIAHHRKFRAAAQTKSRNCRHNRLLEGVQFVPQFQVSFGKHFGTCCGCHFFDVSTGGEGFVVARQHNGVHGIIFRKGSERRKQFVHQVKVQRVEGLWAIELHNGNFRVRLLGYKKVLVRHDVGFLMVETVTRNACLNPRFRLKR
jgi:hypothetical protein